MWARWAARYVTATCLAEYVVWVLHRSHNGHENGRNRADAPSEEMKRFLVTLFPARRHQQERIPTEESLIVVPGGSRTNQARTTIKRHFPP